MSFDNTEFRQFKTQAIDSDDDSLDSSDYASSYYTDTDASVVSEVSTIANRFDAEVNII